MCGGTGATPVGSHRWTHYCSAETSLLSHAPRGWMGDDIGWLPANSGVDERTVDEQTALYLNDTRGGRSCKYQYMTTGECVGSGTWGKDLTEEMSAFKWMTSAGQFEGEGISKHAPKGMNSVKMSAADWKLISPASNGPIGTAFSAYTTSSGGLKFDPDGLAVKQATGVYQPPYMPESNFVNQPMNPAGGQKVWKLWYWSHVRKQGVRDEAKKHRSGTSWAKRYDPSAKWGARAPLTLFFCVFFFCILLSVCFFLRGGGGGAGVTGCRATAGSFGCTR